MAKPRPWLIGLLGCCGAFALAIVSCAGFLYIGYRDTNTHVSPRIDELFEAIENGTFAETYETHTTPELRSAATKERYAAIGETIRDSLGNLRSKSLRSFNSNRSTNGAFIEATYAARFERGAGEIVVRLKNTDDGWKFTDFRVNSPRLRPQPDGETCPECDAAVPRESRFCPKCGVKLPADDDDDIEAGTASRDWKPRWQVATLASAETC